MCVKQPWMIWVNYPVGNHNKALIRSIFTCLSNLVITVPTDVQTPDGAKPSTGTVLTIKVDISSIKFLYVSMMQNNFCSDDVFHNENRAALANIKMYCKLKRE